MRTCAVAGLFAFGLLFLSIPSQGSAQGVFLGAGASLPTADYGEYAETGWMAEAGIILPIDDERGLSIFAEGIYGSNTHSDIDGDKTNLLGGFGGVELSFAGDAESGLFVFGEVGFLRHDFKSDEYPQFEEADTGFAFGGGVGFDFPLGERLGGYILGRYLQGQLADDETGEGNTTLFGLMAGVGISFGGG